MSYCILQNETWYLAEDIIFTRLPIIKYRANKTTRSVSSQFHQVQYITHISQIVKQLVIRDSLVCLSFPQLTHITLKIIIVQDQFVPRQWSHIIFPQCYFNPWSWPLPLWFLWRPRLLILILKHWLMFGVQSLVEAASYQRHYKNGASGPLFSTQH
mgnify:CR=1 FL=1